MTRFSIPDRELQATFSRSGGAGGQNVNKVETKATLRWDFMRSESLTGTQKELIRDRLARRITSEGALAVSSQTERSQSSNRNHARSLLERLVGRALAPRTPRKRTGVPRHERERRMETKRRVSEKKQLRRDGRI